MQLERRQPLPQAFDEENQRGRSSGGQFGGTHIEKILPLKLKEEDIKGNKMVVFGTSKENNYDLFYSIIESEGVEVTVTIGDTEKVLFSFMSLSEKYFLAKIFRRMDRRS